MGVVLGSGWAALSASVEDPVAFEGGEVPGFPIPSAPGHRGRLLLGSIAGRRVALLEGRPHAYEGFAATALAFPVCVLSALGVRALLLTNAAGGLNPAFKAGDVMLLRDHINLPGLVGHNPLIHYPGSLAAPVFLDMGSVYDDCLRREMLRLLLEAGQPSHEGVYAYVAGPTYETPAEARLLRSLGADAVGMSTVPEVLAARQAGARVLAISCISNVLGEGGPIEHEQVLSRVEGVAQRVLPSLEALIVRA